MTGIINRFVRNKQGKKLAAVEGENLSKRRLSPENGKSVKLESCLAELAQEGILDAFEDHSSRVSKEKGFAAGEYVCLHLGLSYSC